MLHSIQADQVEENEDGVYLTVGPFTFAAKTPSLDAQALCGSGKTAYCVMSFEDGVLCAFSTLERQKLFEALASVPSVGTATALMVLDCGTVKDILRAISAKDTDFFMQVQGLGVKRVTKVFNHLQKVYGKALPPALPIPVELWVIQRRNLMLEGADFEQAEAELARQTAVFDN